ncbi:D-glycero-beta-D-manno-heptose-7-phosphate kinase [Chryseolinea lacunae]|uniref:Bifunctional protein HldE n=1 Tax=Chryseolinea lacunae TaxID=2801331 RepID=A0ABS1KU98_9BACT|nr:D-glycero-beta-D-manno-heptose-7-phosphate kinase [Chryseolinea lacunae]MBL0743050.1 D-glycero-beta-D-manno-heptose-7-phosphate kinase [Chryseolinea lacunae]
MNTIHSITRNLQNASVLVIGDVMLDTYVYGSVDRISPEAPIPVLKIQEQKAMLGGAGNVISNLSSLGARSCLISIIGTDENGGKVTDLLNAIENVTSYLLKCKATPTVTKTRYVSGYQQILRTDVEGAPVHSVAVENQIIELVNLQLATTDIIVLSDYKKGVLSSRLCEGIIKLATSKNIPVFVDPKGSDYSLYRNATLIKPNEKELRQAFPNANIVGKEEFYARELIASLGVQYCLLTLGKEGMMLITPENSTWFAACKRDVYDVSGAGDTVIASLAAAYATGAQMDDACALSNIAAGIVVGKTGTSTTTAAEIEREVRADSKVSKMKELSLLVQRWRKEGLTVGFTNGCFDLIHVGHIQTLLFAKKNCDRLIVAVNSDCSVKRLKGATRPIHNEKERCIVMSEFSSVDAIVLFEDDTPEHLIRTLKPDVLIKGADYKREDVVGFDFIQSYGGHVVLAPYIKNSSTTGIISKMQSVKVPRFAPEMVAVN